MFATYLFQWLFVSKFFPNTSILSPDDCWTIWEQSEDYTDMFTFEACCRQIMGESRIFTDLDGRGSVGILPKGTAWMRDIWITDSKWSIESDFMLHGLKHSILVPSVANSSALHRARVRSKWGPWWNPFAFDKLPLQSCASGNITWRYWKSRIIDKLQLKELLSNYQETVRKDFYYYAGKISSYL